MDFQQSINNLHPDRVIGGLNITCSWTITLVFIPVKWTAYIIVPHASEFVSKSIQNNSYSVHNFLYFGRGLIIMNVLTERPSWLLVSTFQISFSAVFPFTLFARGFLDTLGLSKSSPSLSVSDNWASWSLALCEQGIFSSDAGFSSAPSSSAR